MAAANESQGLKIAVAAFVSLTVILAVSCYFLYSSYDQTTAKLTKAEQDSRNAQKAASDALLQYDDMRKQIGSRAEEFEGTKAEIKAEVKKIDDAIAGIAPAVADAVAKVQGAGGNSPDLEDAKTRAQQIAASYASEPNKTLLTSLGRLKDLIATVAQVDTAIARNYAEIRVALESANKANAAKLEVETKNVAARATDLEGEQKKHIEARAELLTKVDQLQTDNARMATEIATLTTKLRQVEEDLTKKLSLAQSVIGELNDYKTSKDVILDRPDGYITYVDYNRGEVRTNLTYSMGARPQMILSIFDRNAPGIPTEKPKGTIELIYVGERYSLARIVKTFNPIEPFRDGDIVYSAAWSPNKPMRFALIGKLDVNRDGHDDRNDLIRMIQAAGGIVDYNLPPPDAGKEQGKITGLDSWYVTDDRMPLREYENRAEEIMNADQREFLTKRTAAIKEARLNGVRPMKLERLLNYLGYDFHAPIVGRAEAIDMGTIKGLTGPRGAAGDAAKKAAAPATEEAAPKEEAK